MENNIAEKIAAMAKKDALNIELLNKSVAKEIVDSVSRSHKKLLKEKQHLVIFEMSVDMFQSALGAEREKAEKLYSSIQKARKNVPLTNFIKALCFNKANPELGKYLGEEFNDLYTMAYYLDPVGASEKDLQEGRIRISDIEGLGPKKKTIITSKEFWDAVDELSYYVIPLKWNETQVAS